MLMTCLSFIWTLIAYSVICVIASFIVCFTLKIMLAVVFATLFVKVEKKEEEE